MYIAINNPADDESEKNLIVMANIIKKCILFLTFVIAIYKSAVKSECIFF